RAVSSGTPDVFRIHQFHRTTRRLRSRTMRPLLTAFRTERVGTMLFDMTRSRLLACGALEIRIEQLLQYHERGKVEDHREKSLDVALFDGEVDVNEQHRLVRARVGEEEVRAVAVKDLRQGNLQVALQAVRHRGEAAVQEDVSGLGEGLLLELHDVVQRQLRSDQGADQLHAPDFGKDEQR